MAEKNGKEGSSGIQWWRDLPGWVQAVVAVLTLIGVGGAGGAVIHAAGSNSHNQPTHSPSTSEAPRSVASGHPIWSGPIAIASGGGGIDLDYNPPTHGSNDLTFDPFNGFRSDTGNYTIAPWNGGTPTYSMCHTWAETHVIASAPAHVGAAYCLLTGEGNTAYLKVTGINSTLDNGTVMVNLVVWNS
jgi:hypothetical protein